MPNSYNIFLNSLYFTIDWHFLVLIFSHHYTSKIIIYIYIYIYIERERERERERVLYKEILLRHNSLSPAASPVGSLLIISIHCSLGFSCILLPSIFYRPIIFGVTSHVKITSIMLLDIPNFSNFQVSNLLHSWFSVANDFCFMFN